jgi:hypothetical protein
MSHDAQQRITETEHKFLGIWLAIDLSSIEQDVPFLRVCTRYQSP